MIAISPFLTLLLTVLLPLLTALLCFALNRLVSTRLLVMFAAIVLTLAAIVLLLAQPLPMVLLDLPWLSQNTEPVRLLLKLDQASRLIGLLLFGGAALAMLVLASAIPADLRRFGTIPATLLMLILAVFLGIINQAPLIQALLWMMATLATAGTLRVSGPDTATDAPLIVLLAGSVATMAVLCCELLLSRGAGANSMVLVLGLLAVMLALGLPPLHAFTHTSSDAPSVVAGVLTALGLPLLGAFFLLRLLSFELSSGWLLGITVLGLVTMFSCCAAAFGSQNAGKLLTWQHGAQQALILIVAAQSGLALRVIAPTLILVAALSTLAASLALAVIERVTGSVNMRELRLSGAQTLPGLIVLMSAAAAAGLPGSWGFWGRVWLLTGLAPAMRWLAGPVLAASLLILASAIIPIAAILRRQPLLKNSVGLAQRAALPALLVTLPLILFGIAPQLALEQLIGPEMAAQFAPHTLVMFGMALAALFLIGAVFLIANSRSRSGQASSLEHDAGPLPAALAESMRPFTWLARPAYALNMSWTLLLNASQFVIHWLGRVEDRYYIASLMVGLIIVILVFL